MLEHVTVANSPLVQRVPSEASRMRIRFQFSLRWMLIIPFAVGIFVVLEKQRANHQAELAARLAEIDGSFERTRRPLLPAKISGMLPIDAGTTITHVSLGGVALPSGSGNFGRALYTVRVVTTDTLSKIADLPAMRKVKSCTLIGTSVDDELADKFAALPNCKKVTVRVSGVTKSEYYPPVTGTKGRVINGTSNGRALITAYHRSALRLTDDLQIFARALEKEDVDSIGDVLSLSKSGHEDILISTLSYVRTPKGQAAILEAVQDERPAVSSIASGVLERIGKRVVDSKGLIKSLDDDRPYVRHAAVRAITSTPRHEVSHEEADKMHDLATDTDPETRWMVINWLPDAARDCQFETILNALSDDSSMVRAAAARGLGKLKDPNAIPHLQESAKDSDAFVKHNSENAIKKLKSEAAP